MNEPNPFEDIRKRLTPPRPPFREEDDRERERARLAYEVALVRGLSDEDRAAHMSNVYRFLEAESEVVSPVIRAAFGVVKDSNCNCTKCSTCVLREALYARTTTMRTIVEPRKLDHAVKAWERDQMGSAYGPVCSKSRRIGSVREGEYVGCGSCVRCQEFNKFLLDRLAEEVKQP